jgi:hypothetical protein
MGVSPRAKHRPQFFSDDPSQPSEPIIPSGIEKVHCTMYRDPYEGTGKQKLPTMFTMVTGDFGVQLLPIMRVSESKAPQFVWIMNPRQNHPSGTMSWPWEDILDITTKIDNYSIGKCKIYPNLEGKQLVQVKVRATNTPQGSCTFVFEVTSHSAIQVQELLVASNLSQHASQTTLAKTHRPSSDPRIKELCKHGITVPAYTWQDPGNSLPEELLIVLTDEGVQLVEQQDDRTEESRLAVIKTFSMSQEHSYWLSESEDPTEMDQLAINVAGDGVYKFELDEDLCIDLVSCFQKYYPTAEHKPSVQESIICFQRPTLSIVPAFIARGSKSVDTSTPTSSPDSVAAITDTGLLYERRSSRKKTCSNRSLHSLESRTETGAGVKASALDAFRRQMENRLHTPEDREPCLPAPLRTASPPPVVSTPSWPADEASCIFMV